MEWRCWIEIKRRLGKGLEGQEGNRRLMWHLKKRVEETQQAKVSKQW